MIKFITTFLFAGMSCSIIILLILLNKYRKRDHVKEDAIVKEIYSAVSDLSGYYIDRNIRLYKGLPDSILKNAIIDSTLNNILHDLHTIENFKLGLVEYDEVECIIKNKVEQVLANKKEINTNDNTIEEEVSSVNTNDEWNFEKICNEMYGNDTIPNIFKD